MATIRLPPKKEVAIELLKQTSMYVFLDPRRPSVVVPSWFKKQVELVLQVGLNMAVPIPDLNVDDEGISCTLSFNRTPHFCRIPWSAVYALRSEQGQGMVWPDDIPAEIAAQVPAPAKQQPAAEKAPHLRVATAAEPSAEAPPAPRAKPKKAAKKAAKLASAPTPAVEPARKKPRVRKQSEKPGPQAEAAPQSSPPSKSKRDLPPYLRVVK